VTAARGDEAELFRRHHAELVRLLQRRLRFSHELAEDAAGLASVQLLRYPPERERILGWLYTVAKHEGFRLAKRQTAAGSEANFERASDGEDPVARIGAREALELVGRLRPSQRQVLELRIAGLSYREICAATGQSYTWVNRHLTEGRAALRRLAGNERR
jgi:RNA polymerase sigma factor (sigma-70 family)